MPRGQAASEGDTRLAPNGYHYTRTATEWRLTHHIIMEKTLGRKLKEDERVIFVDGKRSNLDPDNIEVREKGTGSLRRRLAVIEARIAELQAEKDDIEKQISKGFS